MALQYLCIVHPNPGKTARVRELLDALPSQVENGEPGVTGYHIFHTTGYREDAETYFLLITFKDQAAYDKRFDTPHLKQIQSAIRDEALLSEYKYLKLEEIGGFDR